MVVEKDINGVEYSYENKDELAFGAELSGVVLDST